MYDGDATLPVQGLSCTFQVVTGREKGRRRVRESGENPSSNPSYIIPPDTWSASSHSKLMGKVILSPFFISTINKEVKISLLIQLTAEH